MSFKTNGAPPIQSPSPPDTPTKPDTLQMLRDVVSSLSLGKLFTENVEQIPKVCQQIDKAFSHLDTADEDYVGTLNLDGHSMEMLHSNDFGKKVSLYKRVIPTVLTKATSCLEVSELDRTILVKIASLKLFLNEFYEFRAKLESKYSEKLVLLGKSQDKLKKENSYDNFKELEKVAGEVTSFASEVFPVFTQHILPFDEYYIDFNLEQLRTKFSHGMADVTGLGDLYSLIVILGQGLRRSGFSEEFIMNHKCKPQETDPLIKGIKSSKFEECIIKHIDIILATAIPPVLNKRQMTRLLQILGLCRKYYEHRTKLMANTTTRLDPSLLRIRLV